jgi:hypothetical protein
MGSYPSESDGRSYSGYTRTPETAYHRDSVSSAAYRSPESQLTSDSPGQSQQDDDDVFADSNEEQEEAVEQPDFSQMTPAERLAYKRKMKRFR